MAEKTPKRPVPGPRTAIPDAAFRCEGADGFAPEPLQSSHFHEDEGGYFGENDLFYMEHFSDEYQTEYKGFFCSDCCEKMGLKTEFLMSLKAFASKKALEMFGAGAKHRMIKDLLS